MERLLGLSELQEKSNRLVAADLGGIFAVVVTLHAVKPYRHVTAMPLFVLQ